MKLLLQYGFTYGAGKVRHFRVRGKVNQVARAATVGSAKAGNRYGSAGKIG